MANINCNIKSSCHVVGSFMPFIHSPTTSYQHSFVEANEKNRWQVKCEAKKKKKKIVKKKEKNNNE